MIPFNRPCFLENVENYVIEAAKSKHLSGDGKFTKECHSWFEERLKCEKTLLTPSCTHALEIAAVLIGIEPGDEVIMPSYTFVSTANAFVLRGAKIVFVDIRPDTMNIDETLIEKAITPKTKAIVPVHYAGVACEMDVIMGIAERHELFVVEDAAQGMMSEYQGKPLGTIGHLGTYSFHETKNYTSGGEGGLLIINDPRFSERAEIIREKGTNRSLFFRGMVDKYSWVDIGSSYLPSELQAAYLYALLDQAEEINDKRLKSWYFYYQKMSKLQEDGVVELPRLPVSCQHNAHMFYFKVKDLEVRTRLLEFLNQNGVNAVFHYIPLHSSKAGKTYGAFHGEEQFTTKESERLIRLPMFLGITDEEIIEVSKTIERFFS